MPMKSPNFDGVKSNRNYGFEPNLTRLRDVLYKLFLNQRIRRGSELAPHETAIIRALLIRKQFPLEPSTVVDSNFLNKVRQIKLHKKHQNNIKFTLLKSVKYLKHKFLVRKLEAGGNFKAHRLQMIKVDNEWFFQHYFGDIAEKMKIPINDFVGFGKLARGESKMDHFTSMETFKLWKQNPEFIEEIKSYLRSNFLVDFRQLTQNQLTKMIDGWSKLIAAFGLDQAVQQILRSLKSPRCKLPWTFSEIKHAVKNTMQFLNK